VTIKPSDILLNDRVAVVTGGGAGIGRGIAAGMAAFGASVAIWERDVESCGSAAEAIGALGIVADVVTATRSTQPWSALPPNSDR
jgi:3-oxoacyl-[acyl-carrier protein] reductase